MANKKIPLLKNLRCTISEQNVKISIVLLFIVDFSCELASNAHKNLNYTRFFKIDINVSSNVSF